eukprot:c22001_g1_i1 orf=141-392(-)
MERVLLIIFSNFVLESLSSQVGLPLKERCLCEQFYFVIKGQKSLLFFYSVLDSVNSVHSETLSLCIHHLDDANLNIQDQDAQD